MIDVVGLMDSDKKHREKVAAAMEEATSNFGIAIARDPSNECHKFAANCHAKDGAASAIRITRIDSSCCW